MIVGVDPGLDGGIAALHPDGSLAYAEPMPTLRLPPSGRKTPAGNPKLGRRYVSGVLLRPYARTREIEVVAIEWVWAFAGEAPSFAFGFGAAYGTVRGAFEVLHPTVLIAPQTWKKTFSLPGGEEGKDAARALATSMWPEADRLFNKSKKRGAGLADAVLIAEHERRKNL